jgi:hypothetical protein
VTSVEGLALTLISAPSGLAGGVTLASYWASACLSLPAVWELQVSSSLTDQDGSE